MNRLKAQAVAPALDLQRSGRSPCISLAPEWTPPLRLLVEESCQPDALPTGWCRRYRAVSDRIASAQQGGILLVQAVNDSTHLETIAREPVGPTLLFGRSLPFVSTLVRERGWQPLVRPAGGVQAAFIVRRDSALRTLADADGARLLMPSEGDTLCVAADSEIRRQRVHGLRRSHLCYAESVVALMQSGVADVGVVSLRQAEDWAGRGGRVLAVTEPVLGGALLASPELSPALAAAVQKAMLAMNRDARDGLQQFGVQAWVRSDREDYLELLRETVT